MLYVTDAWKQQHQGSSLGFIVVKNVNNLNQCEALENCKRNLELNLRTLFTDKEKLLNYPPILVYKQYYKKYKKTYHVLKQIESIVFKEKQIPCVSSVVEAMFMAELKNGLLTGGHDYEALHFPLKLDAATGEEIYTIINGKEQAAKQHDMILSDTKGVISSLIHGPDLRTRILPETKKAVFVVYAPAGISRDTVDKHLTDIYDFVKLVSFDAKIEQQEVYM